MSKPAAAILALTAFLGAGAGAEAVAATLIELPLASPAAGPSGIVAGPDGALWFTERDADRVGRITTAGFVTDYALAPGSRPGAIVSGPDGALWFTESGKVGRITTAGAVSEFPVGTGGAVMLDIAAGPDGNLWYAYELLVPGPGPLGRIGRMTPTGGITEFDLPAPARVATSLAAGPDGNVWFAGYGNNIFGGTPFGVVGSLTTAGDSRGSLVTVGMPQDVTAGPDGGMWFTLQISVAFGFPAVGPSVLGKIGRVTTDFGTVVSFTIPTPDADPSGIAAGPDGNLWFTEPSGNRIGRVTTAGAITELAAQTPGAGPTGIASGPDGAVWFTESAAGKIGRLSELTEFCTPSSTSLCLGNGRFRVEAQWTTIDGGSGAATAVPLGSSSSAGYFWFFSENAPEVVVRAIDGCAFNHSQWFFASGLTNVAVTLRVTDVLGGSKTYTSPAGPPFAPIQDTNAFPCQAAPELPPPPPRT